MLALAAALLVFLALVAAAAFVLAPAALGRRPFDARVRALRPEVATGWLPAPPALRRPRPGLPAFQRLLRGSGWAERTAVELEQANVQLRVGEYLVLRLALALVCLAAALWLLRGQAVGVPLALLAAGAGYLLPAVLVRRARRARVARIDRQLIEFLPALASSLRAGFGFQQAVGAAVEQLGPPLADELRQFLHDVDLGATTPAALQELGRRVGSTDLGIAITAVLVQRTTGGNLPEVLDHVAETLRERERILGDVQTFTAQQRLTGMVLSVYPVGIGLLLLAIAPAVWSKLFTEPLGHLLLGVAVGLQVVGFFAIRRFLDIEV